MPIPDSLTSSIPPLSTSSNYYGLLLVQTPTYALAAGPHYILECPNFYFLSLGYYLIFMLNQTRETASLSFPQEGKPCCRGFQWGGVLLHSGIHGSVFIVEIIGGHSWNWGSVCKGNCRVPASSHSFC